MIDSTFAKTALDLFYDICHTMLILCFLDFLRFCRRFLLFKEVYHVEILRDEKRLEKLILQYQLKEQFSYYDEYRPYFYLIRFPKGELIYRKDSQRQYLLFFLSGKVKVCSNLSNGKSMLICFYTSFRLLGDLEFYEMNTSSSSFAVEPCLCIAVRTTPIRSRLLEDPKFLQMISRSLADKLTRATKNSAVNLLYPLENKLASYIYQVSQDNFFSENLTRLSELLGASYRHLLRTMKEFVSEGILEKCPDGYRITDSWRLMDLAQDLYLT